MFRFTIRDVLWLMMVVGLGVALWISQRELQQERRNAELWHSRGDAAWALIQHAGLSAQWDNDGIVGEHTNRHGMNYTKVYPGHSK
jgi:hypothetical protein